MGSPGYEVQLSEVAQKTYERMWSAARACLDRGDEANAHVKQFRILEDALDNIIPHNPLSPERRLSGALSGIYRVKKGRMRICYIADAAAKIIRIIYISDTPRKAGDSNDPYSILTKLIDSRNDDILDQLGVTQPFRSLQRSFSAHPMQ